MFLKLCYRIFGVRCPICSENLDSEPFCSKHGDVSGFKQYRYNFFIAKVTSLYYKLWK